MKMPYRVIVYEQDNNYFAEDSFGNLLPFMNSDGTEPLINPNINPAPVLQAALNRQGDIYVADGSYSFNLDFQGLNIRDFSRITVAKDARFILPRGYSGEVFIFDSVQDTILDGGFYTEQGGLGDPDTGEGSAERNWTLLHFIGGSGGNPDLTGTFANTIQNIRAWYVGTVIRLSGKIVNGIWGFVNGNKFSNFSVFVYRVGIQFSETGFFNRNIFENLLFQPQSTLTSETGAAQISGLANTFLNVYFIDALTNGNEQVIGNIAELTSNAESTLIIGGVFAFPSDKFIDEGVNTQIIDELNIQLGRNILS